MVCRAQWRRRNQPKDNSFRRAGPVMIPTRTNPTCCGRSSGSLKHRQRERVLDAPDGLPLVTRQLLHRASYGAIFIWLLADWPRQAVPSLNFVVVSLALTGHWAVASLDDGLV
jgi:hypothetical protein